LGNHYQDRAAWNANAHQVKHTLDPYCGFPATGWPIQENFRAKRELDYLLLD